MAQIGENRGKHGKQGRKSNASKGITKILFRKRVNVKHVPLIRDFIESLEKSKFLILLVGIFYW